MVRKSSEIIEDVINSLEYLIDALDDEWHHNDEGEWKRLIIFARISFHQQKKSLNNILMNTLTVELKPLWRNINDR